MGRERTLLERLAASTGSSPLTVREDTETLAESVLSHLRNMLNTRQGHVLTQPEYGMPDVTDFIQSMPDEVERIQEAIRNSIARFEPRLKNIRVTFAPHPEERMILRFEILAELAASKEGVSVWFETTMAPSGKIDIKG